MTRGLVLLPQAQADAAEAGAWYEAVRQGLGVGFIEELDHLLRRIAEGPRRFPRLEGSVRRGLMHRFPYAVYFIMEPDELVVLAVLHQHRHPDAWKR